MPVCRWHIACASRARLQPSPRLLGHEQKIVAVRVPLDDRNARGISYTSQNASRCQPKRRTSARGIALNTPTKHVL